MALTQMQLIQSLGEAMAWFEREINWGVPATELRHLCGRIGELYVAMLTNGQMATAVNQRGYDVVSGDGERISVKTTATTGTGQISFNANTLDQVDRVFVLRINTEEMQIETLLDSRKEEFVNLLSMDGSRRVLPLARLRAKPVRTNIKTVTEARFERYVIRELETGAIELSKDGMAVTPVKPTLRELALRFNIGLLNSNGNHLNTRQLGSQIIKTIQELKAPDRGAAD